MNRHACRGKDVLYITSITEQKHTIADYEVIEVEIRVEVARPCWTVAVIENGSTDSQELWGLGKVVAQAGRMYRVM
jgi:hypothetical protein